MSKAKKKQLIDEKKKAPRLLDEKAVNAVLEKDTENSKARPKRTRRFCLTSYIDINGIDSFLKRSPWIQHWAYCMHDRDVNEDGSPKQPHTHIILYTYEAKTSSAIKKNFDRYSAEYYKGGEIEPQNTLVQELHDIVSQYRYLQHLDNPEKALYGANEVIVDELAYWNNLTHTNGLTDSTNNAGLAILNDFMAGVDCYTMSQRYGKEWIYHIDHYRKAVQMIASEQSRQTFGGLQEMCQFALADSTYTEEQITLFFGVLSYVQAKFADKQVTYEVQKYLKA